MMEEWRQTILVLSASRECLVKYLFLLSSLQEEIKQRKETKIITKINSCLEESVRDAKILIRKTDILSQRCLSTKKSQKNRCKNLNKEIDSKKQSICDCINLAIRYCEG
jgi:hypothetical protein